MSAQHLFWPLLLAAFSLPALAQQVSPSPADDPLERKPAVDDIVHVTLGGRVKVADVTDTTSAEVIQRFYDLGVYPDWWKLEPFTTDAAWENACAAITANDPNVRGIVVLGLDASEADLAASLALAAKHDLVKGFAIGRTIFGDAARGWLKGEMTDTEAVTMMSDRYARLAALWDKAREGASQ